LIAASIARAPLAFNDHDHDHDGKFNINTNSKKSLLLNVEFFGDVSWLRLFCFVLRIGRSLDRSKPGTDLPFQTMEDGRFEVGKDTAWQKAASWKCSQ